MQWQLFIHLLLHTSNELLEECRTTQWSHGDDGFLCCSNQLWIYWLGYTRNLLTTQVSLSSIPITNLRTMTPEAEKVNGWMAMLGVVAALGAYATTGQIIPGIF